MDNLPDYDIWKLQEPPEPEPDLWDCDDCEEEFERDQLVEFGRKIICKSCREILEVCEDEG